MLPNLLVVASFTVLCVEVDDGGKASRRDRCSTEESTSIEQKLTLVSVVGPWTATGRGPAPVVSVDGAALAGVIKGIKPKQDRME
jgi:hypothetical protein